MSPQFSVLCGILHFAHLGHASFSLGQAVAIWSPLLQSWHPPKTMKEDDDAGSCKFPLKKLMSVSFNVATCFSTLLPDVSSSCSSGRDSYGVSPSSPRNSFNFRCSSNQFFDIYERSHHAELSDLWPQSGQEPPPLLNVLYLALPKQLVQAFEIFLNPFFGFLLDGIHLHSDVINIYVPVLLLHQHP